MAKKCYIGVDGVARKVKKGYIGIEEEVPIYEAAEVKNITDSNITEAFSVENGKYYFVGSGSTFTTNNTIRATTASTVLTAKMDMDISFTYSYSSGSNYDKFTLIVGGYVAENEVCNSTVTKTYTGELLEGDTISFEYKIQDGRSPCVCSFSDMSVSKKTQIGSEFKTVARRIRKAYVGIGGVARPCWSDGGSLTYYGVLENQLSEPRKLAHAISNGTYAIFAGGWNSDYESCRTTEAYDSSLTKTLPSAMSYSTDGGYDYYSRANVGNKYTLLECGPTYVTSSDVIYCNIGVYDASLSARNIQAVSVADRSYMGGASLNNFALFAGGKWSFSTKQNTISAQVDAFNDSLTIIQAPDLSEARLGPSGTSVGTHAIFAGGGKSYSTSASASGQTYDSTAVDSYDISLTRSTLEALATPGDVSIGPRCGINFGKYALFYGQRNLEGYNASLTKTVFATNIVHSLRSPIVISVGDYMLTHSYTAYSKTLDIYNASLTKTATDLSFSTFRSYVVAASVGDYALYAGGTASGEDSSTVEAFTV